MFKPLEATMFHPDVFCVLELPYGKRAYSGSLRRSGGLEIPVVHGDEDRRSIQIRPLRYPRHVVISLFFNILVLLLGLLSSHTRLVLCALATTDLPCCRRAKVIARSEALFEINLIIFHMA